MMMTNPKGRIVLANWMAIKKKRQSFLPIQKEDIKGIDFENYRIPIVELSREIGKDEIPLSGKTQFVSSVHILTETSKMAAYSFSLPAGTLGIHGSCPASNLHLNEAKRRTAKAGFEGGREASAFPRRKPPGISSVSPEEISGIYICDACYAGKSSYAMYNNVHVAQRIRFMWVQKALEEGTFADEMTDALIAALGPQESFGGKHVINPAFFRIHDSGDFFSPEYMFEWFRVCENIRSQLPRVRFWAPTRVWGDPDFDEAFGFVPENLSLRPSALFYGISAPRARDQHEFLAAGTASSPHRLKGHWDCPAYKSGVLESCEGVGCRTCWTKPLVPVNYPTH